MSDAHLNVNLQPVSDANPVAVKIVGGAAPGSTPTQWEDGAYTLDASGNLKSETQVNSSSGATRTRTWTYTTSGSDTVATPGAWA